MKKQMVLSMIHPGSCRLQKCTTFPPNLLLLIALLFGTSSCSNQPPRKEDQLFHAGPVNSGFGVIYFELYKGGIYQFCDGDFMDPGCYTGTYTLSGDTITLNNLKEHNGIPFNKFLVRRYKDMDSSYWAWKNSGNATDWENQRPLDSLKGSTGDIFPLGKKGELVFDKNNYFLIRMDKLRDGR